MLIAAREGDSAEVFDSMADEVQRVRREYPLFDDPEVQEVGLKKADFSRKEPAKEAGAATPDLWPGLWCGPSCHVRAPSGGLVLQCASAQGQDARSGGAPPPRTAGAERAAVGGLGFVVRTLLPRPGP